jgi:aminoglycoside phosphotransferase (APT) family kinase protein
LDRYREVLEPEYRGVVGRVLPVYPAMLRDTTAPRTLQHGDYRLDNLLFDVDGPGSVHILDWGTVSYANGLTDVGYFIGTSLDPQCRRAHERELVEHYYDGLRRFDIGDYDRAACWRNYERCAFQALVTSVVAPMVVERSERSDRLFLGMVRNSCEQLLDLNSFAHWE